MIAPSLSIVYPPETLRGQWPPLNEHSNKTVELNTPFLSLLSSSYKEWIQMGRFHQKICYDKAGNLPNKGRNFNTQTWGKIVYFLFVWLVGIGFRQNFFRVLPNFWRFWAKMSFFHYIINQNRNNFIKHCSPPCTKKPLISRDVYLYKKFAVQVGSWYTGGNDVL